MKKSLNPLYLKEKWEIWKKENEKRMGFKKGKKSGKWTSEKSQDGKRERENKREIQRAENLRKQENKEEIWIWKMIVLDGTG